MGLYRICIGTKHLGFSNGKNTETTMPFLLPLSCLFSISAKRSLVSLRATGHLLVRLGQARAKLDVCKYLLACRWARSKSTARRVPSWRPARTPFVKLLQVGQASL